MMTLALDPNAEIPPYEQLRRRLIEQISMGQLPKDTKLPAVRCLAADLALAAGTVVAPQWIQNPQARVQRLTAEYIAAMQCAGFGSEAIVRAVQRG